MKLYPQCYQVFNPARVLGSQFDPCRALPDTWAIETLHREITDKKLIPVGYNETFDAILVARPSDV